MNAAECLLRTAAAHGVRVCFANPGTTELELVAALDRVPEIRPVLCLCEGVCSAAADGYARMTGVPALTLLHLGPGFANGIANFHNAKRAFTPVLNVIGDHATWHRGADPPLASDIERLARPVSRWLRSAARPEALGRDTSDAIEAALAGGVATLIVPQDVARGEAGAPAPPTATPHASQAREPDPEVVEATAHALASPEPAALLLGGAALSARGLEVAGRIEAATGAALLCDTFPARVERGPALPGVERLAYFPEPARERLARLATLVLAGTRAPVAFFGYPGEASSLVPPDTIVLELAGESDAVIDALEAVADRLGARAAPVPRSRPGRAPIASELGPESIAAVLAATQPEGAIVMDEGLTAGLPYFGAAAGAPAHTYLALTGGAIGQGLPAATGAALACPERPVIAFQADGSGLYTLQALWTQAREGLDVTNVILANRGYKILALELERAGIPTTGEHAMRMTSFDPAPDWLALARGFGVPAVRVNDTESLRAALQHSFAEPGPHLIEVPV